MRKTVFTTCDFEYIFDELMKIKRVFAGCKDGKIYSINYES